MRKTQNSTTFSPLPPGSALFLTYPTPAMQAHLAWGLQPVHKGVSLPTSSSCLCSALMWALHGFQFLQEYPCAPLWHPAWAAGYICYSMEMFLLHFPLTLVFLFLNRFSQKCLQLGSGTQLCLLCVFWVWLCPAQGSLWPLPTSASPLPAICT